VGLFERPVDDQSLCDTIPAFHGFQIGFLRLMFSQKTSKYSTLSLFVTAMIFSSFAATGYAKPTPTLQQNLTFTRVSPIMTSMTQATTDTPDPKTDDKNPDPSSTLTPVEQAVVNDYVTAGYVPTDEQLKKFPPPERQKIIAEVIRELQLKQTSATQENGNANGGLLHNVFSEYGLQILALIISLFGVILAVSGFSMANSKKKKHISKFMNDIDDAFNSYKWKSKRCEAELYRLHDMIEDKLKDGQLDESSYQLLSSRIEKYLKEIHEVDMPKNIHTASHLDAQVDVPKHIAPQDQPHHEAQSDHSDHDNQKKNPGEPS